MFGVLAVTNAFLPALRRSARPRIVNVSSGTGSLAWSTDPERLSRRPAGAAYRSSKTALNALTVFYAHALAGDGFKVNALAPGLRATELNARAAADGGDPAEAAAGAVRLALLPDDGPTGEFVSWDGTPAPGESAPGAGFLGAGRPPPIMTLCRDSSPPPLRPAASRGCASPNWSRTASCCGPGGRRTRPPWPRLTPIPASSAGTTWPDERGGSPPPGWIRGQDRRAEESGAWWGHRRPIPASSGR